MSGRIGSPQRRPDRSRAAAVVHLRRRRRMSGFAGDTLASALLANGVQPGRALVQVSPPARHPHGRVRRSRTRWSSCAPARGASRTRARRPPSSTTGSIAASQNRWPSLALRHRRRQRPALAAFSPRASTTRPSCGRRRSGRRLYEPLIRRAAGLGRAAGAEDPGPLREGVRALRRAGDRRRARRA